MRHHPVKKLLKKNIKYHLVPPYLHRRNAAKCAIQTFIPFLCAADPKYPAKEWDCFLPQANLTLNILRE